MTTRARHLRQHGAALLTAMLIVSLIATIAAAMVWQQWRAIQIEAAERAQSQAQWILNGALDWARLILREDARDNQRQGNGDHLGEPWAVPLADARLSTFLAADRDSTDDAPEAFLQGSISDLQARYNLRNLVQGGRIVPAELEALRRLCDLAGLGASRADALAAALQRALPAGPADPGASAPVIPVSSGPAPLLPPDIEQLGWLGLDEAAVRALKPLVTLLPTPTPVNLNTAPKEVIAAVVKGADLASAQRLVQNRLLKPLRHVEAARESLGTQAVLDGAHVGVSSSYFEVRGALRTEALVVAQRSLVQRDLNSFEVRTLRTERVDPSLDPKSLVRPTQLQ